MAADPYKVLQVDKNASQADISKAYRQLARKYHPDLNPDDEAAKKKFQEVQSAFDILGDEKKRKQYDRFGHGFDNMGGGGGHRPWPGTGAGQGSQEFDFDLNDLFGAAGAGGRGAGPGGFADLFKNFTRGGGTQSAEPQAPAKGADLDYRLTVPFATAVNGGQASVSVRRPSGKVETISVKIPAGIESGKKIRLRGQGETSPLGGQAGDLLIAVDVAPHPHFRRQGSRLDVVVPITLAEALAGGAIEVPTPKGTITLKVPPGTSGGKKLRVRGHGVQTQAPGDLYAEIRIVLPEGLTDEQRQQLVELAKTDTTNPRGELQW